MYSVVKEIHRINEKELEKNISDQASWHEDYRNSAYIYFGNIPYDLTEGDVIAIFSQYGTIVDIKLQRDKSTGKSMGYGWLAYEDQRSTDLAVDNFAGIKILGRTIRVDHCKNYKRYEENEHKDDQKNKRSK